MATQSSSTTTGVGSSSVPTILEILTTTRNPDVWQHFNLCKMSDNSTKAQCKHCFGFLSSGSNSTLRNHINHPHCEALKTVPEAGQSSMARDGSVFVFNSDVLREQFAGLVIQQGLLFDHLDNSQTTRAKQWFNESLEGLYNIYYTKYGNPTQSTSGASSSRASSGNPMTNLLNRLKEKSNKRARNDRSLSSEYERYVNEDFISHLEPYEFAVTSVASESAFSTSGRMLSIRRTRLTPTSLEMYFEEEILDTEVQENEAIALSDEEIALDAASETRSNGSGSKGEEFDYDLTLSD
ncbi:zinc finger BED domain-containing protein RICESLEEPER 2 [Tanacetum coccineum]|uniref:Zinc finger BED domain-containing protein RICESLEEPER 2 n=1 Tax=Tanacetum coccineum TaxID=301880 RepID=A0ABQ5DDN1_9ASTR